VDGLNTFNDTVVELSRLIETAYGNETGNRYDKMGKIHKRALEMRKAAYEVRD
jgi:hypothetical protein